MTSFRAFRVEKTEDRQFLRSIVERDVAELPDGDLLIDVEFSSLNYKDGLSATGNPGVTRNFPHTPGIDAAGTVVESSSSDFSPGDAVIAIGFDLGMNTPGGFGQKIRIPAGWAVPMPDGLDARSAMILGTAPPAASARSPSGCSRISATRCTRSPARRRATTFCAASARGRSCRARMR